MKQKLLYRFFLFLLLCGLNQLILFTSMAFVFWSSYLTIWSETGRLAFYILSVLNLLISGYLSLGITFDRKKKKIIKIPDNAIVFLWIQILFTGVFFISFCFCWWLGAFYHLELDPARWGVEARQMVTFLPVNFYVPVMFIALLDYHSI